MTELRQESCVRLGTMICLTALWIGALPTVGGAGFGKLGPEFQVNSYTGGYQANPAIAPQTDGGFTIVWSGLGSGDGVDGGVFSQRFDGIGSPVASEFRINQTTVGYQTSPSVALATLNIPSVGLMTEPYTVWSSNQLGPYGIFGLAPSPFPFPPSELMINGASGSSFEPRIAGLAGGGFVVAWRDYNTYSVAVRAFDDSFSPLWNEQFPCPGSEICPRYAIAADPSGGFVLAFTRHDDAYPVFPPVGVDFVTFDSAGVATGGSSNVVDVGNLDIARAGSGFILVRGDATGTHASRFSSSGTVVGAEFQVNMYTSVSPAPRVAVDAGGDFVVVWESNGADGNGFGVFARRFDSSGNALGDEVQVNTTTAGHQSRAGIAALTGGDFMATWNSSVGDGSSFGVFAQRLGAVTDTPTPTGPTPTPTPPNNCPLSPASGCRTADKSILLIKNDSDDTKDKLLWKWIKGEATMDVEDGDPAASRAYALCIYDTGGRLLSANVPPHATNWSGLKYKDASGGADGIQKIILKPSAINSAKVLVKGKGAGLPDVALGSFAFPVRAQMINDETGLCFEGSYNTGQVIKNDATQFKAKAEL